MFIKHNTSNKKHANTLKHGTSEYGRQRKTKI